MNIYPNFYVLTGGPGTGKTSVLEELKKQGFTCVEEVAREIIREQMEQGGDVLPWGNIPAYTTEMLQRSIGVFQKHTNVTELCFFDRGIPDTYGYACLTQQPAKELIRMEADRYRYNKTVFLFPAWPEIYSTDEERKQDLEEAIRTTEVLRDCYIDLGYFVIDVPKLTVPERVSFILENINSSL